MAADEPATTHAFPERLPLPDGKTEIVPGPAAAAPADPAAQARREAQLAYCRAAALDPTFAPHAEVALERRGALGEGGMGIVERVLDKRLGREAALKLMRDPAPDPALVRRFRREAEVTARLDHPSIPPVYEAGTDGRGRHYLLMRVIEGEPLVAGIRRLHGGGDGGPPPRLQELLEALVKVGEAVAYAHTRRVVHRDLKPHNVIVGRFGEVMVVDWGLARTYDGPEELSDSARPRSGAPRDHDSDLALTEAGSVLGTPGYMAPEQARGERVDQRADVFALGAMLCEVLTGRTPIEAASPLGRIEAAGAGRVATPRRLRRDVPAELESIAARALEPDAARRMASAEAFVADLRAYLAGAEVPSHRYGPAERVLRWTRRNPTLLVGASVAAVLVTIAALLGRSRAAAVEARERLEGALGLIARAEDVLDRGGDVAAVGTLVGQALVDEPTPLVLWGGARVLEQAGLRGEARAALERVVAEHPPAFRELLALHRLDVVERHGREGLPTRSPWLERMLAESERLGVEDEYTLVARAIDAFDAGRLDEVIERCDRALAISPRMAWAHCLRGRARLEKGDLDGAQADVSRGIELEPRVAPFRLNLVAIHLRRGDREAAVAELTRTLQVDPGYLVARLDLARLRHDTGDFEAALAEYDRVVRLLPDNAVVLADRAATLNALGRYREAVADCDRSLALEPAGKAAKAALLGRGVARDGLGQPEGMADLDLAVGQHRDDHEPLALRARVHATHGRFDLALRDLDRAVALAPGRGDLLNDRANLHIDMEDLPAATADLDAALELWPRHAALHTSRARLHLALSAPEAALAACDRALELSPGLAMAHATRAAARLQLGDAYAAIADATRAIELQPTLPDAFATRARARERVGDLRGASEDWATGAERAAPQVATTLLTNQARLLIHQKRLAEAIAVAERALTLAPDNVFALLNRAVAKELGGKGAAALADYDRAIALSRLPLPDAFYMRGNCRRGMGDPEGALADWTRAIGLDPANLNARYNRGLLLLERGDAPAAVRDLQAAVTAGPTTPRLAGLARALEAAGDLAGAIGALEAAIRLERDEPVLKDLGRELEAVRARARR